jgi:hypothetical protein
MSRAAPLGPGAQVFALMHASRVQILQLKFAQTIYYQLVKACFNQTRFLWAPGGYPPRGPAQLPAAHGEPSAGAGPSARPPAHAHNGATANGNGNGAHAVGSGARLAGVSAERQAQAERLLAALGGHRLRRGPHHSNPFDAPPDTVDWSSHALSAFHHMLGRGFRPSLEMLDL